MIHIQGAVGGVKNDRISTKLQVFGALTPLAAKTLCPWSTQEMVCSGLIWRGMALEKY